jgi:hypothetical protein
MTLARGDVSAASSLGAGVSTAGSAALGESSGTGASTGAASAPFAFSASQAASPGSKVRARSLVWSEERCGYMG